MKNISREVAAYIIMLLHAINYQQSSKSGSRDRRPFLSIHIKQLLSLRAMVAMRRLQVVQDGFDGSLTPFWWEE